MEKLPPEIILSVLEYCVTNHYGNKNSLLNLRTVCKLFDHVLKPFVLQTLQLEFTRLDRISRSCRPPDEAALRRIGHMCHALYLDLMMIRDDGEVRYLGKIFSKIPNMGVFIDTLRDRYCMNEESFTEVEYRQRLGALLEHTPNASAVRLNLPFQLISRHCRAATMILGNTIEALARRPEESAPLRTLVVENLTDTTVVKLWHNPRDVKNIMDVFAGLEHLVLSVRRHEEGPAHTVTFRNRLWEMIGKAPGLRSLCLVGLDLDEKQLPSRLGPRPVKTSTQRDLTLEEWQFRSVPTIRRPPRSVLPHLACLELRRVEVMGCGLLALFRCFGSSLRELYLDHVYLKTAYDAEAPDDGGESDGALWVGLPNARPPPNHRWVAVLLRQMQTRLRVCRASNLGYDQYVIGNATAVGAGTFVTASHTITPGYDLRDPCGLDRPLEQRFVEVVLGHRQPAAPDGSPIAYFPEDPAAQPWALADRDREDDYPPSPALPSPPRSSSSGNNAPPPPRPRPPPLLAAPASSWWSAEHYLDGAPHPRNPTSGWQRTGIDGRFPNCNPFTLHELQHIADTALEGMSLVQLIGGPRLRDDEEEILAELTAAAAAGQLGEED